MARHKRGKMVGTLLNICLKMHQPIPWKFYTAGLALLLVSQLWAVNAHATSWQYAEVDATRSRITVADTEFNPVLPRLKLGLFITPQIMLEAQYAGSGDDTVANTQMQVENITAAYLRLDSGIHSDMRMYVLLGSAKTKLKSSIAGSSSTSSDTYNDFSWGVGMEQRVWSKYTLLTLEYIEYYRDETLTITGLSLGLKLEF